MGETTGSTTNSDDQLDSMISDFDQIYQDFKCGITTIQSLQSSYNAEIKKREALQFTANSLKSDKNEIQDLKDCLMVEQEEKNGLTKKLQNLEKQCDNIFGTSTDDAAESLFKDFGPAMESRLPWAAVLGNHDQESTMTREELMSLYLLWITHYHNQIHQLKKSQILPNAPSSRH